MNKYEIVRKIEEFAPLETQETWDCSGWGVELFSNRQKELGTREQSEIKKILFGALLKLILNLCSEMGSNETSLVSLFQMKYEIYQYI